VFVHCPACGEGIEFQSKSGECLLRTFSLDRVPINIAKDLHGEAYPCSCGKTIKIEITEPDGYISMSLSIS
jgi:hypothetical protein